MTPPGTMCRRRITHSTAYESLTLAVALSESSRGYTTASDEFSLREEKASRIVRRPSPVAPSRRLP